MARIYGYDEIPEAPVSGELAPGSTSGHRVSLDGFARACVRRVTRKPSTTVSSTAAAGSVHHDEQVLPLANPLSSDMDVMRTTLLPGLLTSLARNAPPASRVRLFETGVAFLQGETMNEVERLAGVATGDALPEQWGETARALDFFDIKGDIERLFAMRGDTRPPVFEPGDLPWMHPGASAVIS